MFSPPENAPVEAQGPGDDFEYENLEQYNGEPAGHEQPEQVHEEGQSEYVYEEGQQPEEEGQQSEQVDEEGQHQESYEEGQHHESYRRVNRPSRPTRRGTISSSSSSSRRKSMSVRSSKQSSSRARVGHSLIRRARSNNHKTTLQPRPPRNLLQRKLCLPNNPATHSIIRRTNKLFSFFFPQCRSDLFFLFGEEFSRVAICKSDGMSGADKPLPGQDTSEVRQG